MQSPTIFLNTELTCSSASSQSCYLCDTAAAAKSLPLCPTTCHPVDGSPPGSSVPGILQARTLEWSAISFPNVCMHARSLQSCPTLCDPMDGSPLGSPVHRILQARILEWVAISFSSDTDYHFSKYPVFSLMKWENISITFARYIESQLLRQKYLKWRILWEVLLTSQHFSCLTYKLRAVSQSQHYWHVGYSFCCRNHALSFIECLVSIYYMPVTSTSQLWQLKMSSVQFNSVTQSCLTLCDPMRHSTTGLPDHHKFPEVTKTHVHWVDNAI